MPPKGAPRPPRPPPLMPGPFKDYANSDMRPDKVYPGPILEPKPDPAPGPPPPPKFEGPKK